MLNKCVHESGLKKNKQSFRLLIGVLLWLHSLSGVIRSLLCNPRASSPAIINIRISVPFMRDATRACARKYGKDAGLSPSSTHVRQ